MSVTDHRQYLNSVWWLSHNMKTRTKISFKVNEASEQKISNFSISHHRKQLILITKLLCALLNAVIKVLRGKEAEFNKASLSKSSIRKAVFLVAVSVYSAYIKHWSRHTAHMKVLWQLLIFNFTRIRHRIQ